jgi:hypothetical protein
MEFVGSTVWGLSTSNSHYYKKSKENDKWFISYNRFFNNISVCSCVTDGKQVPIKCKQHMKLQANQERWSRDG